VTTAKVLWVLTSCNSRIFRYLIDFLGWLPRCGFYLWAQRVSTLSPNICVNCFITFHILVIVCLWLIKFLISHYIVIHPFKPLLDVVWNMVYIFKTQLNSTRYPKRFIRTRILYNPLGRTPKLNNYLNQTIQSTKILRIFFLLSSWVRSSR